jgi:hypothetical protein
MRQLFILMWLGTIVPSAAAAEPEQPRFELGAAAGGIEVFDGVLSWGSRLSVNPTERSGIDVMGDVFFLNEGSALHRGIYGVQCRRTIRAGNSDRSAIFVTGGIAGAFEYQRMSERRQQRSDGSAVVYRRYSRATVKSPAAFSVGVGMQRVLARYIAFRADTQLIVWANSGTLLRGAFGVSLPIGGHYAMHRE